MLRQQIFLCTIDPNIGIVDVVDDRLDKLAYLSKSKKIIREYYLCGYSWACERCLKGEGLGNKFLSHIREVDAVIHLVRCLTQMKLPTLIQKLTLYMI